ncbi:MAG: flagellar basal body P-ring protein FlgI [Planctomycetes bacterium]|nr:flagellar basal body P-ring protein FlgI [Planctomycetota bacterium]
MKNKIKYQFAIAALLIVVMANNAKPERIKDIVDIQGVRGNPLTGVGLVVGLADTGDKSKPSQQMLTNILRNAGVVLSLDDMASGGSIALVTVTAELTPFAREGSRIDVDVSAIADAESLQGGMLLPTPLKGLDGQVYAVAQGGVSTGGWTVSGLSGSVSKNHQTVARIPSGAIVEKTEIATFVENIAGQRFITLNLRNSDFSTARNVSKAINKINPESTIAIDAGTIRVRVPDNIGYADIAGFIDDITTPMVKVDTPAIVVINERTGTIVVGENVGISTVAISQGSLVVKIKETANVSQPTAMFSDAGSTVRVHETMIGVEEKQGYLIPVYQTVTVSDLAKSLNAIGATPRDLIAIFNALKKAGALQAKLEIM